MKFLYDTLSTGSTAKKKRYEHNNAYYDHTVCKKAGAGHSYNLSPVKPHNSSCRPTPHLL